MARTATLAVALALFAFAAVCSAQDVPVTPQTNNRGACSFETLQQAIVFALRNRDDLSDWRRIVEAASNIGTTAAPNGGKFTIFAPTNDALAGAIDGDLDDLILNPRRVEERNRLVRAQITNAGALAVKRLRNGQTLQTLQPQTTITVFIDNDNGRVGNRLITLRGPNADNTAVVITPNNIKACHSFIQATDDVIFPQN